MIRIGNLYEQYKDTIASVLQWYDLIKDTNGFCMFLPLWDVINNHIIYYDKSKNINSFYYKDKLYWLDKDTRIGLIRLIDSGASDVTLLLNDTYVTIKALALKLFLDKLEVYAGKCFATTAKHLQELYQCYTLEELLLLDYTSDYPEKLTLNVE